MYNDPKLIEIIEFVSKHFIGEPDDPADVKIKYLIEDEKFPYWHVYLGDYTYSFDKYAGLNKFVEDRGFKMIITPEGFWLKEKIYCEMF